MPDRLPAFSSGPERDEPALFDRAELLDRIGGNVAVFKDLVALFNQELPAQINALLRAVDRGDLDDVERRAHRVRGALLNLGAHQAGRAAEALEAIARSGDRQHQLAALENLQQACTALHAALAAAAAELA